MSATLVTAELPPSPTRRRNRDVGVSPSRQPDAPPSRQVVPPPAPVSDDELERQWRGGSEAAFGDLFRRHYGRAVALAQRILIDRATAEDVAQAAFVRIYETSRGREGRFDALVLTATRNLSLNEIRRRGRRHCPRPGLDGVPEPAGTEAAGEIAAREEEASRVREAVERLDGDERQVLALRRDGQSYTEIAEALGLHPDAVRRRMTKALDFIRGALSSVRGGGNA